MAGVWMSWMPLRWLSMRLERLLGLRRLRRLLLALGPLCLVLEPTVIFHRSVQRTNSGSLAVFAAILRASSFVSRLGCLIAALFHATIGLWGCQKICQCRRIPSWYWWCCACSFSAQWCSLSSYNSGNGSGVIDMVARAPLREGERHNSAGT
jgi:hypothetical protein